MTEAQYRAWYQKNTSDLQGKTVAITGSTGGLGRALCEHLATLGASLILVDRNAARSEALRNTLQKAHPSISVSCIGADMEQMGSVIAAAEQLKRLPIDLLILNAGAYAIPRHACDTGYDNVFQINFISPYCLVRELLPTLRARHGRVVAVGSIAHNYSKSDPLDVDFATRKKASSVYGNAKRYLTFSLLRLFEKETEATLAVTHPGITFTGITAHYPKLIFALIKHPMKVLFMKPKKASLSILRGAFEPTPSLQWIGPRFFRVWGLPSKQPLRTAKPDEIDRIEQTAKEIYEKIQKTTIL